MRVLGDLVLDLKVLVSGFEVPALMQDLKDLVLGLPVLDLDLYLRGPLLALDLRVQLQGPRPHCPNTQPPSKAARPASIFRLLLSRFWLALSLLV